MNKEAYMMYKGSGGKNGMHEQRSQGDAKYVEWRARRENEGMHLSYHSAWNALDDHFVHTEKKLISDVQKQLKLSLF